MYCVYIYVYVYIHMYLSHTHSEVSSSLPNRSHSTSSTGGADGEGVDGEGVEVTVESFTQPTRYDELVIGTQVPCTPGASQVQVQSTPSPTVNSGARPPSF